MNSKLLAIIRIVSFICTLYLWRMVLGIEFSQLAEYTLAIGPILFVFPVVWIGRKAVDLKPTFERVAWITSFVHIVIMVFFGVSIIEAIKLFQISRGITIPLPVEFGPVLLYITGTCLSLTVVNLALSGLGAPFAIALSKRLANRWMYRWTRNPMVLCCLAMLLSVGLYLQSLYFVLWLVLLVTPAWIYILKVYEERELEIRFGESYLDYKTKTSFLWPRMPRNCNIIV
jgi:protein-S-isoprenylcysteine O-methyltransferase Ste14